MTVQTNIAAYRTRHVIDPKALQEDIGLVYRCPVDGLRVHRTRSGWRHDATAVREAAEQPRPYDPEGAALRVYRQRHEP